MGTLIRKKLGAPGLPYLGKLASQRPRRWSASDRVRPEPAPTTLDPLAHVGRAAGQIDTDIGSGANHAASTTRISRTSIVGSRSGATRRQRPLASTSSTCGSGAAAKRSSVGAYLMTLRHLRDRSAIGTNR